MEQTKENLIHDYNLAVESYNKADYSSFFRNIRPAIEYLSQFLIFEIWGNEREAIDLINGDTSITKNRTDNCFKYSEYPANRKPTGRALPELFLKVFYCKYPDVFTSKVDENKKRLRRSLDSCSSELCRYYCIASEIGSHAGRTNMNIEIQARGCAAFMMGFLDFIKSHKVVSGSASKFISCFDSFMFGGVLEKNNFENELNQLIQETQEKELALLNAQKLQNEAELREQTSKLKIEELEADKIKYEEEIRLLREEIAEKKAMGTTQAQKLTEDNPSKQLGEPIQTFTTSIRETLVGNCDWDVSEETMDDDQLDLIEYTNNKSMLVAGCAGCGKSVIAMHKAEQLFAAGQDVILIAYTKSLNRFMQTGGIHSNFNFFYHYQWKKMNMPTADYIIVDEIQDFTQVEIQEFIAAAKKHFLFFGDTAQSIYRLYGKNTMSIEEISKMTGLNILQLYNNYRLPRPIAKITQTYVGVNVAEYKEKVYQNRESELPHFVYYDSEESQLVALIKLVNDNIHRSIGILLPSNADVLKVCESFKENNVSFEFKYNSDDDENRNENNLNFKTLLPKIMTYHSAKGLQFDLVILPFYKGATDDEARKTLYVAMTRTMHSLYILYSASTIPAPLNIPSHLYLKD